MSQSPEITPDDERERLIARVQRQIESLHAHYGLDAVLDVFKAYHDQHSSEMQQQMLGAAAHDELMSLDEALADQPDAPPSALARPAADPDDLMTVDEALADPQGFVDGMTETTSSQLIVYCPSCYAVYRVDAERVLNVTCTNCDRQFAVASAPRSLPRLDIQ